MKKALTKNWGLKLLAFVFSVLLWIIVMNIEDPVDERHIFRNPGDSDPSGNRNKSGQYISDSG